MAFVMILYREKDGIDTPKAYANIRATLAN